MSISGKQSFGINSWKKCTKAKSTGIDFESTQIDRFTIHADKQDQQQAKTLTIKLPWKDKNLWLVASDRMSPCWCFGKNEVLEKDEWLF